jgi:hypothetical protein
MPNSLSPVDYIIAEARKMVRLKWVGSNKFMR